MKGKRWAYYQQAGNVGDMMIAEGTKILLNHYKIDWVKYPEASDGILISGGGNIGPLWYECQQERLKLPDKPIMVLPQTLYPPMEHLPNAVFYWRENYSKCYFSAPVFHDLSLALPYRDIEPTMGEGIYIRTDREGVHCYFDNKSIGDPIHMANTVDKYIELAGRHTSIVTDRLHFAIAGILARRQVVLLPNSYFKNRAVWEYSLRDHCAFGG